MAQQKIELVFDLDAKDVQFATEKTLTLTEQIRILKKELQKTQEGTKEFEILKNKLNETKDNFERVNVKSRELFGTLSLIPGPIGEIAGKVNGAISLLKTFSGFSLKDITSQFKALGEDIKGIFTGFGNFINGTRSVEAETKKLSNTTSTVVKDTAQLSSNVLDATASLESYKASQQAATSAQEASTAVSKLGTIQAERARIEADLFTGTISNKTAKTQLDALAEKEKTLATQASTVATAENTAVQEQNAVAQEGAALGAGANAVANEALAKAETKAAINGRILRSVLASLGIGVLIVLIGATIGKFMELMDAMKAAKDNTDDLNRSLERQKQLLDDLTSGIDAQVQIDVERAKQAGKTDAEIFQIRKSGLQRILQETRKTTNDIAALENQARAATGRFAQLSEEKRIEMINKYNEQKQALFNKEIELERQIVLEDEREKTRIIEDGRKKRSKGGDDAAQKALERRKAQLDAEIQLEINKANTDEKVLKSLLEKRLQLENLTGAQLLLAKQENQKKLEDALKDDSKRELDIRMKSIDAIIQAEENAQEVDLERLKKLLLHKRDLELQNSELLLEERKAIIAKTDKQIRDIERKQAEDKLVEDLAAARGNFDAQIQLYQQYAQQAISSEQYTQQEKVKIIEDTNRKILELQQQQFTARLTAVQLEFGQTYAYEKDYYDKVALLYEEEKRRYKNLLDTKQIDQATYDAFIAQSNAARIQLDKQELDAKMSNFEAVSAIFAATASLVGEQTKAGKALAIAGATIDTYVAANKVLSDPTPMPTFLRFALAAASIIRGLASVKKIIDTKIPTAGGGTEGGGTPAAQFNQGPIQVQGRAQGGMINGPGTSTSDSIPAMLSDGEFVINARSTKMFQPLLQAINSYGVNTPRFQAGGLVMGARTAQQQTNEISLTDAIATTLRREPIRTYVTSAEVTNQQQFDRIIKSRSLI